MPAAQELDPVEQGYVSIGWSAAGDLSNLAPNRSAFKAHYAKAFPDDKPGAIPVSAGTLFRFVHEIKVGDLVLFPSKTDRMIYLGEVTGPYRHISSETDDAISKTNQRPVKWMNSFPRTALSQSALHEIGSAITLIEVKTHKSEFLSLQDGAADITVKEEPEVTNAASERVEEDTEDFVIRRLKIAISPKQFEEFTAHLLECMGYHSRVTQYGSDGGVDVIAHRDELGFEPPVIKVQCKQVVDNIGRPDVQRLMGATETSEFGLFVTLGGFSREARDAERARPNLRLISGPALVQLIYEHYARFDPAWQTIIPLRQRYVPGRVSGTRD